MRPTTKNNESMGGVECWSDGQVDVIVPTNDQMEKMVVAVVLECSECINRGFLENILGSEWCFPGHRPSLISPKHFYVLAQIRKWHGKASSRWWTSCLSPTDWKHRKTQLTKNVAYLKPEPDCMTDRCAGHSSGPIIEGFPADHIWITLVTVRYWIWGGGHWHQRADERHGNPPTR